MQLAGKLRPSSSILIQKCKLIPLHAFWLRRRKFFRWRRVVSRCSSSFSITHGIKFFNFLHDCKRRSMARVSARVWHGLTKYGSKSRCPGFPSIECWLLAWQKQSCSTTTPDHVGRFCGYSLGRRHAERQHHRSTIVKKVNFWEVFGFDMILLMKFLIDLVKFIL